MSAFIGPFLALLSASFFSVLGLLMLVARCLAGAKPVRAQEPLYTVTGVHVDATAASSGEALNQAIAQRPRQGVSNSFSVV